MLITILLTIEDRCNTSFAQNAWLFLLYIITIIIIILFAHFVNTCLQFYNELCVCGNLMRNTLYCYDFFKLFLYLLYFLYIYYYVLCIGNNCATKWKFTSQCYDEQLKTKILY